MTATPRCDKRRFEDEIAAKLALASIQHRDNPRRERTEVRAYYHTLCRYWHLTSLTRGQS